jgi:hypothetical protein
MRGKLSIGWIPPSKNMNSASLRIRVLEIMHALRSLGHVCSFYGGRGDVDILVVCKKYDSATQGIMREYRRLRPDGIIVFDLCDNHFYAEPTAGVARENLDVRITQLRGALCQANAITTSSVYLAEVISKECNIDPRKVFAIEDCYESLDGCRRFGVLDMLSEIALRWLEYRLSIDGNRSRRFVWFGTHGVSYADGGMVELLKRQDEINEACGREGVSLTIVSNSYAKYRKISSALKMRTYYIPWSRRTIDRVLRLHTFMLLPIGASPFTWSKSSNRPVTAMLHNLLVVCDMIPAYQQLQDHLVSPVGSESLRYVLSLSRGAIEQRVRAAYEHVVVEYSPAKIGKKWEVVLRSLRDA